MCTVLFIPKGENYYFASLRDESPLRTKAVIPDIYKLNNKDILAPIDGMAGGTWIGVTALGTVIILLNGGITKHVRQTSYRKSRGLIVTELLASDLPHTNWNLMDLHGIEPHTLVVWHENILYQLIWDGTNKHNEKLAPNQPYIWSSCTLYNQKASLYRRELFQQWIGMNLPVSLVSLLQFFNSISDSENGFLINRSEEIKTLSCTFIELNTKESAQMEYHDFMSGMGYDKKIGVSNSIKRKSLNVSKIMNAQSNNI